MASDKDQLLQMGFEAERVEWALRATKGSGLQPAMDHILANMDSPIPPAAEQSTSSSSAATPMTDRRFEDDDMDEDDRAALAAHIAKMGGKAGDGEVVEAKSVKCTDCGKIFKNASLVSFHAEKSGHANFEESTEEYIPLTEEQKKARLEELRAKLAEKRANQAKVDAVQNKANEALRRKAGKDQGAIKEDMRLKEAEKEAAQKRKDKLEDAKAKAAIKAQIEADKRARAEKAAREKALRAGEAPPQPAGGNTVGTGGAARAVAASTSTKGADFAETRLQVRRAAGGAPLTKTFKSDAPLSEVAEWIASEDLAFNHDTIKLSMTFPRKTFGPADMTKSLKENGLTPSAVLMAS